MVRMAQQPESDTYVKQLDWSPDSGITVVPEKAGAGLFLASTMTPAFPVKLLTGMTALLVCCVTLDSVG